MSGKVFLRCLQNTLFESKTEGHILDGINRVVYILMPSISTSRSISDSFFVAIVTLAHENF